MTLARRPWLDLAILIAIAGALAWMLTPKLIVTKRSTRARMEDTGNLRWLVGPVAQSGNLPMKDGAFDPYAFVRQGHISRGIYYVLRSQRSGTGPTDEEIEARRLREFPVGALSRGREARRSSRPSPLGEEAGRGGQGPRRPLRRNRSFRGACRAGCDARGQPLSAPELGW